eukprot:SAG31_NODE_910_length_11078_cov_25.691062_1_plen_359_part_10
MLIEPTISSASPNYIRLYRQVSPERTLATAQLLIDFPWLCSGYTIVGADLDSSDTRTPALATRLQSAIEQHDVSSTLQSILGPGYLLIPCGQLPPHVRSRDLEWVGSSGQVVAGVREYDFLPRTVFCLFAGDRPTTLRIVPRSQYYLSDTSTEPRADVSPWESVTLPANTALVFHSNLELQLVLSGDAGDADLLSLRHFCCGGIRISEPPQSRALIMAQQQAGMFQRWLKGSVNKPKWDWKGRWPSGTPAAHVATYRWVLEFLHSGAEEPGRWSAANTELAAAEVTELLAVEVQDSPAEEDRIGAAVLLAAAAKRLKGGQPLHELTRYYQTHQTMSCFPECHSIVAIGARLQVTYLRSF